MSTSTFLGTPLTKYEIDDIETDLVNKKAREFEKEKGLQYRHNREKIKRNRMNDVYTVDTKEGFLPANFKSSKANRASYKQQEFSNFTDSEDADIISKNVLRAIKIDRASLQRTVANMVNSLGFMGKRRFIGPMNIRPVETKISRSLEGIGFTYDDEKGVVDRTSFVKAKVGDKHDCNYDNSREKVVDSVEESDRKTTAANSSGNSSFTTGEEGAQHMRTYTRHLNDRQYDLSEVQLYYKHLYSLIVKSIDVKEDLVEKVAKGIEFTKERPQTEKVIETGRKVEPYVFDEELLQKFRIKTRRREGESGAIDVTKVNEEINSAPKLPAELFRKIFGE